VKHFSVWPESGIVKEDDCGLVSGFHLQKYQCNGPGWVSIKSILRGSHKNIGSTLLGTNIPPKMAF